MLPNINGPIPSFGRRGWLLFSAIGTVVVFLFAALVFVHNADHEGAGTIALFGVFFAVMTGAFAFWPEKRADADAPKDETKK